MSSPWHPTIAYGYALSSVAGSGLATRRLRSQRAPGARSDAFRRRAESVSAEASSHLLARVHDERELGQPRPKGVLVLHGHSLTRPEPRDRTAGSSYAVLTSAARMRSRYPATSKSSSTIS